MKRFVSVMLALAMLFSLCPAAMAEDMAIPAAEQNAAGGEAVQAEDNGQIEEIGDLNPTELGLEENEENAGENIELFSAENGFSTMANDEVSYSTDGINWQSSTLAGAVSAIGSGTGTIKVKNDVTVSSEIKINGNITLVAEGADVTIKRASTLTDAPVISVASGATLNLGTETAMENTLTIDGGAVWNGNEGYPNAEVSMSSDKSNNTGVKANWCLLKNDNGTLNMYDNVILQNNHFFPTLNSEHCGAGVGNNGIFYMYGGKIWNCSSYSSGETGGAVANNGADKKITPPVAFYMYGGEICYNTALVGGGVSVGSSNNQENSAKFEMHGGSIHNNIGGGYASHSGGGVYVNKISSFVMDGGKIIDNSVKYAMSSWNYIEAGGGGIDAHGAIEIKEGAYVANNSFESNGKPAKVYGSDIAHTPDDDTSATVSLPSKTTVDGVDYDVIWYQDGLLDSNNLVADGSIYSESNQIKKTDFSDITVNYGLKAVYIKIEPEVEATYSHYVYPTGDETETIRGTLKEALTKMNSDNAEPGATITVLKNIAIDETITLSNERKIQAKDGETYTIMRATGFTGPMVSITGAKQTIGSENGRLIFDGTSDSTTDSLIKITNSGASGITLLNLELKNNKAENGGAINTTNAAVSATNVTIENCSAVNGGAIYWAVADTNTESITLTKAVIKNNTADTGSAIFGKNDNNNWSKLILDGCTFENNAFSDSSSNADGHKKSTAIYFDNAATTANQYNYINLKGTTTFNNETNSDIMLDNGLAKSSTYANLQVLSGFANNGAEIKVAIGGFSRSNTTGTYVVYDSGMTTGVFKLVGTYAATDIGEYQLKRADYYYLSIQAPSRIYFNIYDGRNSYNSTAKYNKNVKSVQLSVSPAFNVDEELYNMDYAMDNQEYTLTATAQDGVAITDMHIKYNKGSIEKEEYATLSSDGKSAEFKFTKELLSTIVLGTTVGISTCKIYITYKMLTQPITIGTVEGGTITTNPSGSANVGGTVTLNATPNAEYNFVAYKVYKTGEESTTVAVTENGGTYSFTMPAYPVTVSANFVKKQHTATITVEPTEGGSVKIDKISPVTVGETVTVTATPNANWELSALTMNDKDILSTKSFTMPNENVVIKATFVKSKFSVKVDIGEEHQAGGTVDCKEDGKQVEWGTNIGFTVKPNKYYDIDKVLVNGEEKTPDASGNVSFEAAAADNVISATFKKKQFALTDKTAEADKAKGTVAIKENSQNVDGAKLDWGTRITVSVEPKEHWEIESVTIGGKDISEFEEQQYETQTLALFAATPTTYTILVPTYDAELVVTYKKVQYTVSVNPAANGAINFVGVSGSNLTLDWDETVTFTVSPEVHYELDTLKVSGASGDVTCGYDSASGTYSFTMPTENVTISAAFKKVKYNLSMSGANVTFTPNGGSYEWGTEVTFKAEPDEWFEIMSVSAPGGDITDNGNGTYKFTMPQGNLTVSAVAIRPSYNITFEAQGGSAVGSATVLKGETITKPTVPTWTNHGFAGWYLDSSCTQKYDFTTKVTGDVTLYARWFLWGDVNGDGKADSFDALQINRCYVKLNDLNNLAVPMAARVSGADKVRPDSFDALLINRHYVKYIDVYPVEVSAAGYEFDLENNTYIAK